MAHKVHPKIYRIQKTTEWDSRGFYEKNFKKYLKEDFEIRKFLEDKLNKVGIEKVEIERSGAKTNIIIFTARPGIIIGRGGEGVEKLKEEIKSLLVKKLKLKPLKKEGTFEIRIEIREVKDPWFSASLSAQWIIQQLERRVPYRRVLKQSLIKIMSNKNVKGARVELAGRLDGVEIARTEWLKNGRMPRQNLRADIDYSQKKATCTYGAVGVKVWIYKGEKF